MKRVLNRYVISILIHGSACCLISLQIQERLEETDAVLQMNAENTEHAINEEELRIMATKPLSLGMRKRREQQNLLAHIMRKVGTGNLTLTEHIESKKETASYAPNSLV